MRISDWSSDVCSSDLLHFDNLADRLRLVGCTFIMGLRDAVADPIAKLARPPVATLPVLEPARPDRLGVLFGKKGRLQLGLAPLGPEVEQRIAARSGRLLRHKLGRAFDVPRSQARFSATLHPPYR